MTDLLQRDDRLVNYSPASGFLSALGSCFLSGA